MITKKVWTVLIITFLVKCILAATTELTNDEVYYWTYAQHLQWCYFDHPAMIALLIRLSTFNLTFQSEFFLRLGPMLCGIGSGWLMYLIGKKLKDEHTGFIALLMFTASPYSNLMAGWLLIPDAPQLLFWLWSVYLMVAIIKETNADLVRKYFLLLGLAIGCTIYSKASGIFLWLGFLLYILFYKRAFFRSIWLYASGLISVLFIAIIFYWNETNQFISYSYHSNRVSFFGVMQVDSFFRELFGEAIYNNPISYYLIISTLIAFVRGTFKLPLFGRLLLFNSVPLILVVLFVALFRDTLPHWTGPAYSTLLPFAAVWISDIVMNNNPAVPRIVKMSVAFTFLLLLVGIFLLHFSSFTGNKERDRLGKGDVTLDLSGFAEFERDFSSFYRGDEKQGIMKPGSFVISDYWFPAAHMDYYVCRPNHIPFLAIGPLNNIHNYAWLNPKRKLMKKGDDAYLIIVSNYFNLPSKALSAQFESVMPPVIIPQERGHTIVRNFFIYRMKNYKGEISTTGVLEDQQ